jgi:hypothetical protein
MEESFIPFIQEEESRWSAFGIHAGKCRILNKTTETSDMVD